MSIMRSCLSSIHFFIAKVHCHRRQCTVVLIFALLQGCSFHQVEFNQLAQELDKGKAEYVLTEVESWSYPDRDYVQYQLSLGLLRAVNGDFTAAIKALQAAKAGIAELKATSVSENLGAVSVNETLRSYASTASEQMLLQQLLALSYLMQNDLDGARVEILQMQEIAKTLPDKGLSGMVASSYYLGGLIYEIGEEYDNAMISYRQAYEVTQESGIAVPSALKDSLLYASKKVGLHDEHSKYSKQFGYQLASDFSSQSQLVILYWDGVVSSKKQHSMSVYAPSLGYNISLALPYYADHYNSAYPLRFSVLNKLLNTEPLDNVDKLARADLKADSNAIYAATLARVMVKQTALHEIKERDSNGIATLILNISSIVSEVADVRSWNMLPASIQIKRETLPAGRYYLQQSNPQLTSLSLTTTPNLTAKFENNSKNNAIVPAAKEIQLKAGQIGLVFASSASNKAFYYSMP